MRTIRKAIIALTAVAMTTAGAVAVTATSQPASGGGGPTVTIAPAHLIRSGTESYSGTNQCSARLSAVVADGYGSVTIKATVNGTANTTVWTWTWRGDAPTHVDDTFGTGGLAITGPLTIAASWAPHSGPASWFLYGDGTC